MKDVGTFHRRQGGLGVIGLIVIIAIAVVFFKVGFALGPVYLNHSKILSAMKKVSQDPASTVRGAAELRSALGRYWTIEDIEEITPEDIKVKKTNTGREFAFDYEVRKPIVDNISMIVHFEGSVALPGGDAP